MLKSRRKNFSAELRGGKRGGEMGQTLFVCVKARQSVSRTVPPFSFPPVRQGGGEVFLAVHRILYLNCRARYDMP